jgi:hypothetical protein
MGGLDSHVDGGHVALGVHAVSVEALTQRLSVFFGLFELFPQLGDRLVYIADVLRQLLDSGALGLDTCEAQPPVPGLAGVVGVLPEAIGMLKEVLGKEGEGVGGGEDVVGEVGLLQGKGVPERPVGWGEAAVAVGVGLLGVALRVNKSRHDRRGELSRGVGI